MADSAVRRAEIIMALFLIVVATALLSVGWNIKPNPFEPIGSGTIPNSVCIFTIVLALAHLVQTIRRPIAGGAEAGERERWQIVLGVVALTIVYVGLLAVAQLPYPWVTAAFLPLVVLGLTEASLRRQKLLPALVLGVMTAFALDYVFRNVLVTDLP